jgi:hypothetical protein
MTPKANAERLIFIYSRALEIWDEENSLKAKQCALIAVEEIKGSIKWSSDFNNEQSNYWREVKKEIENL